MTLDIQLFVVLDAADSRCDDGKGSRETKGWAMCGRFVMLTHDEVADVIRSIEMDTPYIIEPDWPARRPSAYPGSTVPIIAKQDALLFADDLKWGFEVEWQKGLVFNTRIETALGPRPGMWKTPLKDGRCIVPTAGFFEPHATETVTSPRTGKQIKRQYLFDAPGDQPTYLAAVRNDAAFSIVTTEPNRFVAPVHKRMPIVLRQEEIPIWLNGDFETLADRSNLDLMAKAEG